MPNEQNSGVRSQESEAKNQEPGTVKLQAAIPTPQPQLAKLPAGTPEDLTAKLIEALDTGHYFITISCQKKDKPADPHDLKHFWICTGYMPNDVVPSLRHIIADFCAKEMPNAEAGDGDWH